MDKNAIKASLWEMEPHVFGVEISVDANGDVDVDGEETDLPMRRVDVLGCRPPHRVSPK